MNNTAYQNNIQPGTNYVPATNNMNYNIVPERCITDTQNLQPQIVSRDKSAPHIDCNFVEKYRIRDFRSMIGNEDAISTLMAESKYNCYQPAKILFGPPSSGKSCSAIIQAKLANCQSPQELGVPCDECDSCKSAAVDANPDIIRINAGNHNGVETSREIEEQLQKPPLYNIKVVILEEWQKMTPQALTSLLTVIENPSVSAKTATKPKYIFIMPTTELPTDIADNAILSRAIVVNFYPIPKDKLITRLSEICYLEGISFEDGVLEFLYENSNGAMRDCLKNLQALATRSDFNITLDSAKRFFGVENSSLAKDLFASIHSLNPVKVSSVIENYCNNSVLKECDFNDFANLFVEASKNSTPFMYEVYTNCLRIIRDNRIVFLRDPSRKAQENLIIACQEIVAILRGNLGLAVSNHIKERDLDLGNLLLSLEPNTRINNGQIIFTLNPPTLGLEYLLDKFKQPEIISAFNNFWISSPEFNNIGRLVCNKVAADFDRNFADLLFNLNPVTRVENRQLILYLNQPTMNPQDFMNKINSAQMTEILNSFGITQYCVNGLGYHSINSNVNNSTNNNYSDNNAVVSHINNTDNNAVNNNIENIGISICHEITTNYDPNFGNFLIGLNPITFADNQNQLIFLIDKPNMDISYFESFICSQEVRNIFAANGIANHQYR